MKTIKLTERMLEIDTMYRRAKYCPTKANRSLLGYMLITGQTNNEILCGAYHALSAVERAMEERELYQLYPCCKAKENERKIKEIVDDALNGIYDSYAVAVKDIDKYLMLVRED